MACARGCCESFLEHVRSLRFLDSTEWETTRRERQLAKDQAAFKRFRDRGITPRHLRGSDRAEALCKTVEEVEGRPAKVDDIEFVPIGGDD